MDGILWIGLVVLVAFILLCVFLNFVPLGLWISALSSGVHVPVTTLMGMKIRRIQPKRLVLPLIKANKAGLNLTISKLERTSWPAAMWIGSSTP
mgnify:CR=1 FL=1